MPGTLPPDYVQRILVNDGVRVFPAAGYKLHTYQQGTTTNEATYSDEALTVPNSNPITLGGEGDYTAWLDTTKEYTFVLKTPGGATVWTRDITPTQIPTSGNFVAIDGSTPMTGELELPGDATASLSAVPKQQLDAALAAATENIQDIVDAATQAADDAVAAAQAIKPTHYMLANASGSAATRDVDLTVGTWMLVLETFAEKTDSGNYNFDVTQSATVSGTGLTTVTVTNTLHFERTGGSGFGRSLGKASAAVGSVVISTDQSYTLAMQAASLSTATSKGSVLHLSKQ